MVDSTVFRSLVIPRHSQRVVGRCACNNRLPAGAAYCHSVQRILTGFGFHQTYNAVVARLLTRGVKRPRPEAINVVPRLRMKVVLTLPYMLQCWWVWRDTYVVALTNASSHQYIKYATVL
jgi:hypothetical protein